MKNFNSINRTTLRRYCDEMWVAICKHGHTKCEWCGKEMEKGKEKRLLNTHHLITRQNLKYRHDLNNHINICSWCHKFGPKSVHTSPWFFEGWMKINKPEKYKWFIEHREDFDNKAEDIDLRVIYFKLEDEYKKIFNRPFKTFNKIFTKDEEVAILEGYLFRNQSMYDLAKIYNCSRTPFQCLLKRHKFKKGITVAQKEEILRKAKISIANSAQNNGMFGKTHVDPSVCNSSKTFPKKAILQYTLDLELVREWDSIASAEKELGIDGSSISRCCTGKLKKTKGYVWKFKPTDNG